MNAEENQPTTGASPPSPCEPPSPVLEDARVIEALEEYLAALESGQKPNRQAFLARHALIAEALAECLDGLHALHEAGSSPHHSPAPLSPSEGERGSTSPLPSLGEMGAEGEGTDKAVAACTAVEWPPGTLLGEFRIIREIGRGGMGVVYEAEQLSLGRRIALKVLPFAWSLDPRQLQRFKNEARAAAQLYHQNIVPVYAVGCERGVHFFAMQYIEGQTLADVIREVRQLGGKEGRASRMRDRAAEAEDNNSTIENRESAADTQPRHPRSSILPPQSSFFQTVAQLGVQAAEALEHAHGLGVIHRDIKPGNLLVDVRGQLWVSDFGLAQFQRDAALTLTGDLLGTMRYMSPEQALAKRGMVDHRTDIYSLGVTLYELLTGQPAYNGRDREELLRQITWEEPCLPRRLNRLIPADLETIVLKAMAKGADERYAAARELADDLRRFLEQKPIWARRPTLLERAAKWSRRHRALVTSVAGMLVLAAVGFAASTVLIAREQVKTRAAYERVAEEQTRTKAAYEAEVRNFQQARHMLEFFAQVSAEELADKPEAQEVRRKLLEAALEYYQDFIKQCPDDPSTREELARSHLRVANLLNGMGATADALAALEQAHRLLEKKPDPELQRLSSALRLNWLRNGGPLLLLEQPSVQEELELSEEQVRRVARLAARRRAAFWDSPDLSLERWRTKFEELAAREKVVLEGLAPEQARRLKQIAWQEGGASAFSDPELLQALAVTKEQNEKIRAIHDESRRTMRIGPRRGGPRPEDWKKAADSWKKAREQVLSVLTADQTATWKELTGEPFQGEIRLPFPSSFGLRPTPWPPKKS